MEGKLEKLVDGVHSLPEDLVDRIAGFMEIPTFQYMEELSHHFTLEWVTVRALKSQSLENGQQRYRSRFLQKIIYFKSDEVDARRILTRILVHREMAGWCDRNPIFISQ
uniref:Uncharacterized protein n=1 Tax=viral metagenome TaxID=1070528 RepID=A0A6C0D232_9ZZZZ